MLHNAPTFMTDPDDAPPPRAPRLIVVLLMLVGAAATFSYLMAYAVPDALMAADMLGRWPEGADPRPRRFGLTFGCVMGASLLLGAVARFMTGRQLRRIDAMSDE